jgi:hypothetical protein
VIASWKGVSLLGWAARRYLGSLSTGVLSHLRIVLRDRLVMRAIVLTDLPSRKCIRRIFPIIAMVITSIFLLVKNSAE